MDAATFEPHYAEITQSGDVQIYESIMGTPAGAPTTGLLQATGYLKDNRCFLAASRNAPRPPKSPWSEQPRVTMTSAAGAIASGTGVPVSSTLAVTVEVALRYQPIAYRWVQNLAAYDAAEPKRFLNYVNGMARESSTVVASTTRTIAP